VFASLPTALADVRALQGQYADSKVVTTDVPDPEMDAVVVEAMSTPPVGKVAIARTLLRAARQAVRPARPANGRPQLQVPAQDAQWFVLSRLDSVTVGTADGRGVTFRHRDPATAKRLGKRSLELNREIRRRFPELQQQYRAAWDELTSKEAWRGAFGEAGKR
jgi:galactofuranosylgalactofuranosylrhamnosyl-N-acetylglucosaminyl-diphospho-decaprenol beta-1,5/1,6-galactofuranosyltransferase